MLVACYLLFGYLLCCWAMVRDAQGRVSEYHTPPGLVPFMLVVFSLLWPLIPLSPYLKRKLEKWQS